MTKEIILPKNEGLKVVNLEDGNQFTNLIGGLIQSEGFNSLDIEKFKCLIEMKNSEEVRLAKLSFNEDFTEMQPFLPKIISVHDNKQTKSKYAKIEDINQLVLPIISKYGFGVSFSILSQEKESVTIKAVLLHKKGHKEETSLTLNIDNKGIAGAVNKTNAHGVASTITYAKKYLVCMLLNISTGEDNDGNSVNNPSITTEQIGIITDLTDKLNIHLSQICKSCKISNITEMTTKNFKDVQLYLLEKLAKKNNTQPLND